MLLALLRGMPSNSHVMYLLGEISAWRAEGLLGEVTYRLLRSRYDQQPPPPLCPTPPAPGTPGAPAPQSPLRVPCSALPVLRSALRAPRSALENELQQQAEKLLAADPPPEPGLEQQLALEVEFHQQLERQVRATAHAESSIARAVAQRPLQQLSTGQAVAAASAALCDVVGVGVATAAADPEPRPSPQQQALQRDSLWSSRLQPFLHENALWLASGLLVLCGSLYFLSLIWDQLSSLLLHGVIAGSLLSYGAAFFGVGHVLARKRQAHTVARILFCFSTAILPLASVATGELAAVLLREGGAAGGLAALAAAALALSAQGFMLSVMGGLFERSCARPLVWSALGLSALIIGAAPVGAALAPGKLLLPGTVAGLLVLRQGLLSLCQGKVNLRASLLFVGGGLLWFFAVLVGRVQVAAALELPLYAPMLAALAGLLITCDHRLRLGWDRPARLTALNLALHALLPGSLVLALVGLGQLGYFHLWARNNVLATALVVVFFLWQAAARYGRSVLTYLAAGTGLFCYFFLSAPFAGLVMLANKYITTALGYSDRPLPLAYYGLTFIPYLVGLSVAAVLLIRRQRPDLGRALQRFLMALSALLVLAAMATGSDLRPMLWTWPIYAAGAHLWAWLFDRRWLHHAGQLLTLASLWVLGLWLEQQGWQAGPGPLLALYGLICAATSLRWRRALHLSRAALAAAGLSLVPLIWSPPPMPAVCLSVGLAAVTLALCAWRHAGNFAGRFCAHLASLLGLALTVLCCIEWVHAASQAIWILALYGLVSSALVFALWRAADHSPGRRLVAQPATVSALLALGLALVLCVSKNDAHLVPGCLLLGVLLVHLALVSRGRLVMFLCSVALIPPVATLAAQLHRACWPAALCLLACGLLLGAGRLRALLAWPHARKRALALLLGACVAQLAALWGAGIRAEEAAGAGWLLWAALACGEAAVFFLCAIQVARGRAWAGVPSLAAVGLASTGCVAFVVHYLIPSGVSSAWHLAVVVGGLSLVWSAISQRLSRRAATRRHLAPTAWWIAGVLPLLPLLFLGWYGGLAMLQCGHAADSLLSLLSLQVDLWAPVCAALCLLAAWRLNLSSRFVSSSGISGTGELANWGLGKLDLARVPFPPRNQAGLADSHSDHPEPLQAPRHRGPRPPGPQAPDRSRLAIGRLEHSRGASLWASQLLVAAGVGLCVVGLRLLWPIAHLSLVLGLAAVALAWLRLRSTRENPASPGLLQVPLAWPLCLGLGALAASHGHLAQPHLLAASASVTAVLVLLWRARRGQAGELGWALSLLATGQVLVLWLARELSTGRHPPASVLALMALAALSTGLLLDWLLRRASSPLEQAARVGRVALVLAVVGAASAVAGCFTAMLTDVLVLCCVTLAGACAQLVRVGLRDGRRWMAHCATVSLTLLYLTLRTQTALRELGPWLDAAVILLASQLALWSAVFHRWIRGQPNARGPLLAAAVVWPLLALFPCLWLSAGGAALLCMLVALHYVAMISALQNRHLALPAMLFGNAALALSYAGLGWSDIMLYLLPGAVTLLGMVHIYRDELGERGARALRGTVLVLLYSLATGRALVLLSPFQALVLVPSICVAGIVAGTLLRVRVYVWMGVGFLAADLLLNMLRHGLAQPHLGALFLTLTGLMIVACMVVFTLEKERILSRYSAIFSELRTWE